MKKFLFLCHSNSCRSQIAQGWLNHLAGDKAQARSAGSVPIEVNPLAIQVMQEAGVDISEYTSKSVDELPDMEFDYIVTVCNQAKETCPYVPSPRALQLHRGFPDPTGKDIEAFRQTRDQIKMFVEELLDTAGLVE